MAGCGRRFVLKALLAAAAAAVTLCASTLSSLAAGSPLSIAVQVGYHNNVKLGQWMPVTVDITNNGPDFEGTLEVQTSSTSNGPPVGAAVYEAPVSIAQGATKHFRTYVTEDVAGTITARVTSGGREVASQDVTSANTTSGLMVAVVSDQPTMLDRFGGIHPGGTAPVVVHVAAADVPDSFPVLRAFDAIAIDDFASDVLTAGQKAALQDYVLQGGALLIGAGGSWHKTLGGLPASLVPMQVTGSKVPAAIAALGGASGVEVATGTLSPGATAWLAESGTPLLVEKQAGRGVVMLATFDWGQSAVTGWSGFDGMLRQTLVRMTYGNLANPTNTGMTFTKFGGGTSSLANKGGALGQALGNLPALDLPAWWLVGALVVGYVLLVGPVNYFVLRAAGRRALAWVTVPTIAIVASGGAYGMSVATKGTAALANEVSVIHVQPGSDRAYQEEYTGIMTPTRGDYQVGLGGGRTLVSPIYYYNGGILDSNYNPLRIDPTGSAITLPGMTAFTLRAFANEGMLPGAPAVTGQAKIAGGQLTGTVQNSSSIVFTDGVVIAGNNYQKIGELRPGAAASFSIQPTNTASLGGPPLSMTVYPNNFSFTGVPPNNPSDVERQAETRSAVLGTLFSNAYGGLPATTQPFVVLWTQQPFQNVTINGSHPRTFVESAVVLDLPIQQVGAGALPAGVVQGRMIDLDADTSPGPPGIVIANNGSIVYSFDPALAAGTHLSEVTITNSNPYGAKGFAGPTGSPSAVKAQVWDWSTSAWMNLSYQENGATTVPDSAVNPTTGEVRLRLSSDGQFAAGWMSLTGTVR